MIPPEEFFNSENLDRVLSNSRAGALGSADAQVAARLNADDQLMGHDRVACILAANKSTTTTPVAARTE